MSGWDAQLLTELVAAAERAFGRFVATHQGFKRLATLVADILVNGHFGSLQSLVPERIVCSDRCVLTVVILVAHPLTGQKLR